ncbi:hypothetical protein SDC9_144688 [bioreactor metagenome]|uniref:Uncharacterized protein n=1 Tax=bioreactor metagenome TaxID=1076179 RepID=A0A645E7Q3_9ZZZZ
MNVNSMVISALTSLGFPVAANAYNGTDDEYIVFNYADERPALRADDMDLLDETTIQVHYFTRGNPQTNKKIIRRLLRTAGFTIQSTQEMYESDTKYFHVVVYAWIEGVIDD